MLLFLRDQQNLFVQQTRTVHENIIGAPKMRNIFGTMSICTFLYCSPFSFHFSNFAIAKVVALNIFATFLYWFCTLICGFFSVLLYAELISLNSYRTSNFRNSNSFRSFSILKAIFKSEGKLIAIAFQDEQIL